MLARIACVTAFTTLGMIGIDSIEFAKTCDCSQMPGNCTARASYNGREISFKASTMQCAEITYDVNGDPSATTVTDGSGTVSYSPSTPGKTPTISVNSCSVCKTNE